MNFKNMICAGVLAFAFSGTALGATFDFDRASGSVLAFDSYDVYTQTVDGITVNVTGIGDANKVSRSRNQGLGVGTSFLNYLIKDNESLTFEFSQAVNIDTIVLESYGDGTLTWDGGSISGLDGDLSAVEGLNGKYHNINLTNITSFTIEADSNYLMVDGLVGVSAVPLPAAAWLFGSALMGLVAVGRRRAVTA